VPYGSLGTQFHARSKHTDVQYHYIRELKEAGVIDIRYIQTGEMAADCLTKLLKRQKFAANLMMLGLREERTATISLINLREVIKDTISRGVGLLRVGPVSVTTRRLVQVQRGRSQVARWPQAAR
jgi:hypothetical protein